MALDCSPGVALSPEASLIAPNRGIMVRQVIKVALRQLRRFLATKSSVAILNEVGAPSQEKSLSTSQKVLAPASTAIGYWRSGPIWTRENGPIGRRH